MITFKKFLEGHFNLKEKGDIDLIKQEFSKIIPQLKAIFDNEFIENIIKLILGSENPSLLHRNLYQLMMEVDPYYKEIREILEKLWNKTGHIILSDNEYTEYSPEFNGQDYELVGNTISPFHSAKDIILYSYYKVFGLPEEVSPLLYWRQDSSDNFNEYLLIYPDNKDDIQEYLNYHETNFFGINTNEQNWVDYKQDIFNKICLSDIIEKIFNFSKKNNHLKGVYESILDNPYTDLVGIALDAMEDAGEDISIDRQFVKQWLIKNPPQNTKYGYYWKPLLTEGHFNLRENKNIEDIKKEFISKEKELDNIYELYLDDLIGAWEIDEIQQRREYYINLKSSIKNTDDINILYRDLLALESDFSDTGDIVCIEFINSLLKEVKHIILLNNKWDVYNSTYQGGIRRVIFDTIEPLHDAEDLILYSNCYHYGIAGSYSPEQFFNGRHSLRYGDLLISISNLNEVGEYVNFISSGYYGKKGDFVQDIERKMRLVEIVDKIRENIGNLPYEEIYDDILKNPYDPDLIGLGLDFLEDHNIDVKNERKFVKRYLIDDPPKKVNKSYYW